MDLNGILPPMDLKISRILHAGYVFECEDSQVAFDPIFENPFSRNCHAFPSVDFDHEQIQKLNFSAVFISHYHDDHCSFESLNHLDRRTPIYMFCVFDEIFEMLKLLGFENVHSLQIDVPVKIGEIEITPRRALDADVDSMFHIQVGELNVLNVVDSWMDPETLQQLSTYAPWDMVLWPFQTMREVEVIAPSRARPAPSDLPPEWSAQLQALNPKFVVPSSCQFKLEPWSWYNEAFFPISYKMFQEKLAQILPLAQIVRMNPSVSVVLNKKSLASSGPLSWVHTVGEQDVDYSYKADMQAPPTSAIAQRFEKISAENTQKVLRYCQQGLIEKYQSMDPPLDEYFEKPRLWRLSIYNHLGVPEHFQYLVQGNKIQLVMDSSLPLSWLTEVPISKLYAALDLGESLTSMYMRINDCVFDSSTELEVQTADIVDDPLMRCLFSGAFGSYQAAQLKRLNINLSSQAGRC